MTKAELENRVKELETEVETLTDEIEAMDLAYNELESELADLTDKVDFFDGIRSVENFKRKLEESNLMSDDMVAFLDNYIRWYND